jgi:hypothetical protein
MGPTPPGTGVIQLATSLAVVKSTSPTNLYPAFFVLSVGGKRGKQFYYLYIYSVYTVRTAFYVLSVGEKRGKQFYYLYYIQWNLQIALVLRAEEKAVLFARMCYLEGQYHRKTQAQSQMKCCYSQVWRNFEMCYSQITFYYWQSKGQNASRGLCWSNTCSWQVEDKNCTVTTKYLYVRVIVKG